MMPVIDACYAWRVVRDAMHRRLDDTWCPTDGLTIGPDGTWSSQASIDAEAAQLLDTLLPIACGGSRYVVAQLGQSLDGRIATHTGHSHYVTGQASRTHLHRLRALVDAVVVGAGTVAADDPKLTVRHVEGDHPVRIVLDPKARVSGYCQVFTDHGPPTWHAVHEPRLAAPTAHALTLPDVSPGVMPSTLLALLAEQGLTRVLIEGGGVTISRFIDAGCVDRLHTVVAPMLIGSGRPALALETIDTLDQARRPKCHDYAIGDDRLYDLDLRQTANTR